MAVNGWAGDALVDSYESERRPVAEHNLIRSLDPMGTRRDPRDELGFDLGGRLPHLWLDRPQGRISTLDLLGPGVTLLTTSQYSRAVAPMSGVPPIVVHRVDQSTALKLGVGQTRWVAVAAGWRALGFVAVVDHRIRRGAATMRRRAGTFTAVDRPEPAVAR